MLDLPQLEELHLSGFTYISNTAFTISSLPNLHKLTLENCESLNRILGLEAMPPHLKLVADAADRPIDNWLTGVQWDKLESLSLEGAGQSDIFAELGALPKDLVESLVVSFSRSGKVERG